VTPYARTFPCPNCNEMITETATQCRFCAVPIDPGVAELSARRQEQVNQACSDASYLRATAVGMHVFLVASLVLGMAFWAFVVTFWMGVFLVIRWQLKFSDLLTNDPDYPKARRSKNISALVVPAALPLGLILNPFAEVLLERWKAFFCNCYATRYSTFGLPRKSLPVFLIIRPSCSNS
jgi:hypothetical protein